MSFRAGIFEHYKGGRYLGILIAESHVHNGDRDVVYYSIDHAKFCTRPYERDSRAEDSWIDEVEWPDGTKRRRFELVREYLPIEMPSLLANLLLARQNLEARIEKTRIEAAPTEAPEALEDEAKNAPAT